MNKQPQSPDSIPRKASKLKWSQSQEEACTLAKSMTNASIDGMVSLDERQRIIAWNKTAAQWSGLPEKKVIGKAFFDVFPAAGTSEKLKTAFEQALLGRKSFLKASEKAYLPGHYEVHILPLYNEPDAITGILMILHDVAHRIKAEDQLKKLNQQLARQNEALQQAHEELAVFAKIAAHDLKEPLRKIYTFSELIMMHEVRKLSSSGRSNFRRIQKSVQRMGLLTDDLVNFTTLSAKSEMVPVDMAALLTEVLLRYKEEIGQKEITLQLTRLPVLNGDAGALRQLLQQLLHNAFKFYNPEVPLFIQIGYTRLEQLTFTHAGAEEGVAYHCISVRDNGVGFEMIYKDRIFELFQRLHPEGTYSGSGMGLAMVRKAMSLHSGFVQAESVPGVGSTFYCYFPVQ